VTVFVSARAGITNAREAMKKLPEEEKQKIAQQVEVFRVEKRAFDREVRRVGLNPLKYFFVQMWDPHSCKADMDQGFLLNVYQDLSHIRTKN